MPFRQLKSFFKILIGVQYHCIAIHPGMPAEYPQKRQSLRLHRCFRCGWPLMCGRQDSITLWSIRRRAAGWQQSTGLLRFHWFEPVAYTKIKKEPAGSFFTQCGNGETATTPSTQGVWMKKKFLVLWCSCHLQQSRRKSSQAISRLMDSCRRYEEIPPGELVLLRPSYKQLGPPDISQLQLTS